MALDFFCAEQRQRGRTKCLGAIRLEAGSPGRCVSFYDSGSMVPYLYSYDICPCKIFQTPRSDRSTCTIGGRVSNSELQGLLLKGKNLSIRVIAKEMSDL
jgi:hypothetical protein